MKDKEKQIEEMAKDIYEQKSCDTSFEENCKLLAYDLVSLGWVKIPEDKVVLSREEYEWLTCCFGKFEEIMNDIKELAHKETAEKIFNHLLGLIWEYPYRSCFRENDLKEFAKQFGVEIKE